MLSLEQLAAGALSGRPPADVDRLAELHRTQLLDSPPDPAYDRIAEIAARMLEAPVALVSLVDEDRQFFQSCIGLAEPGTPPARPRSRTRFASTRWPPPSRS